MGIFSALKGVFRDEPVGPTYSVDDITFHHDRYRRHALAAHDCLDGMMADPRWLLILRDPDRKVNPVNLLARVRWRYLETIRGWVEDHFVEKIARYRVPNMAVPPSTAGVHKAYGLPDDHDSPIEGAASQMRAMDVHGKELVNAINFFLCDRRSAFDQKRAYEDEFGPSSPMELTLWFANGRDIVQRNIERIKDNFDKFIAFARENS